jgi:hypothetical protein
MKKLYITIIFFLLLILGLLGYMLIKADLSLQPVKESYVLDKSPRTPVYLVSYADGHEVFFKNQHALVYSAQNKGFDFFMNYRKCLLDKDFVQAHADILNVKAGAGLWLWKPQILLQTMERAPAGVLIVYIDVGFILIKEEAALALQKFIGDHDVMLVNTDDYQTKEKLLSFLPRKIANEWNITPSRQPKFIASGLIVVRNTPTAKKFIEKWRDMCARRDYAFVKIDNDEKLKGFTYDQSLLSIVADQYPQGVTILPFEKVLKPLTIFHHRHPGNNRPVLPLQVLPAKQLRMWIGKYFPHFFMWFGF